MIYNIKNMLTINQIFFSQVVIFICSIPSSSILYTIIIQREIELIFFVKGVILIVLYYFFWSIIFIIFTGISSLIKPDYYEIYSNILTYLSLIYDSSLFILNIIGAIFMMQELTTIDKKYTSIVVYYIIYQILSGSHVIINIKLLFNCNHINQMGSRITSISHNDNNQYVNNTLRINIENNRRIYENNMIHYVNNDNNDLDININLNYLRVKNIPEVLNQNIEYCCICMENLIKVKILPCNHREFCLRCIEKLNEFKCPLCRNSFNYIENEIPMTPILNNIVISEA